MTGPQAPEALLVGPVSIDRYVTTGERLPGGGALNMAYHWSRLGRSFALVSRVSVDDRSVMEPFLHRHGITCTPALWQRGPSCSVDVRIGEDRQPTMDNFVEGIWSEFSFTADELAVVTAGTPTHLVLVDAVDRELLRRRHDLVGAHLSGDFLSFVHFDRDRFDATFPLLDLGVIGWPGALDDPLVADLGRRVGEHGNVLVVTFGSRGVTVFDGRAGAVERHWFEVRPVEVVGTTIGCGDAFIAAFLATWHGRANLAEAVAAARSAGAAATQWRRPLPDEAYT